MAIRMSPPPRKSAGHGHIRRTRRPRYPILGYWQPSRSACRVDKSIYSAEYQRLCAILRELRQQAGLTQVEVAARLGEPQSFVSKYESGERRLDVIELRQVALALDSRIDAVLKQVWHELN
jgi:ribosome-binding protein aMBF1 (putative translation factor)